MACTFTNRHYPFVPVFIRTHTFPSTSSGGYALFEWIKQQLSQQESPKMFLVHTRTSERKRERAVVTERVVIEVPHSFQNCHPHWGLMLCGYVLFVLFFLRRGDLFKRFREWCDKWLLRKWAKIIFFSEKVAKKRMYQNNQILYETWGFEPSSTTQLHC